MYHMTSFWWPSPLAGSQEFRTAYIQAEINGQYKKVGTKISSNLVLNGIKKKTKNICYDSKIVENKVNDFAVMDCSLHL